MRVVAEHAAADLRCSFVCIGVCMVAEHAEANHRGNMTQDTRVGVTLAAVCMYVCVCVCTCVFVVCVVGMGSVGITDGKMTRGITVEARPFVLRPFVLRPWPP